MRISTEWVTTVCAVCDRTLLQGERSRKLRRAPGEDLVDVCALCERPALEHGWVREGAPLLAQSAPLRRRPRQRLPSLAAVFLGAAGGGDGGASSGRRSSGRSGVVAPEVGGEPILRRLSEGELAAVEAAELFNASDFRRTAAGLLRSLGPADVSVVPLPGVRGDVVITVAWELSWYQYRVSREAAQPVRLLERGYELDEIDGALRAWNAHLAEDGAVVLEIDRI